MARFSVTYTVSGRAHETIEADSLEAATAAIEAKVDDDDFEVDLDDIDDVDFDVQQMHPVTRNGREIWTTYMLPTDVRGHQSALKTTPLFSGVLEKEAAAAASGGEG